MRAPARGIAAEIKLMCPAPMRTTIVDLVAQFEAKSPHKVTIVHTPSRMIVERIQGGEAFDVSILTGAGDRRADQAGQGGAPRRYRALQHRPWRSRRHAHAGCQFGRGGEAHAARRSKSFARNEGAESGKHMLAVFDRLGIAEQMKGKTKAMPVNTGYVAELVMRGEAEMAAQQMPELKAVPGIDAVPLPPELQLVIVFSAGSLAAPKEPGSGRMRW